MHYSAQFIGRLFALTYYEVLCKSPEDLHKFYHPLDSIFHHEGFNPWPFNGLVYGQLDIEKKIRQLKYRDCSTVIKQVGFNLKV